MVLAWRRWGEGERNLTIEGGAGKVHEPEREEKEALHLAKVIGTVVSTAKVPSLKGHRLLVIQPCDAEGVPSGETIVAVDTVSAAPGQLVFFVKGREAASALPDKFNPVDATIIGLPDAVTEEEGSGKKRF